MLATIDLPRLTDEVRSTLARCRASGHCCDHHMVVAVDGQEHIVHVAELGYASTPVFVSIVAPRHSFLRSDAELRKSYGLSPRQIQVAHMLAERCSNKEIASRLRISVHTVSSHVRITMLKLGVCRRSDVRDLIRGRHPPAISV